MPKIPSKFGDKWDWLRERIEIYNQRIIVLENGGGDAENIQNNRWDVDKD